MGVEGAVERLAHHKLAGVPRSRCSQAAGSVGPFCIVLNLGPRQSWIGEVDDSWAAYSTSVVGHWGFAN